LRFVFLILILFLTLPSPGEQIREYYSTHQLHPDGSLTLQETIEYDFASRHRHGIYRDLPLAYRPDMHSTLIPVKISILSVKMDGRTIPWESQNIHRGGIPWLHIKIGNPHTQVNGRHTYQMTFRIDPALIPQIRGELAVWRWNLLGSGWKVPIDHFVGLLRLPPPMGKDTVKLRSYYGPSGATSPLPIPPKWNKEREVRVSLREIPPGSGITLECQCDRNILNQLHPTFSTHSVSTWGSLPWWGMGGISLLTMILIGFFNQNSNSASSRSVTVRYRPPEGISLLQAQRIFTPSGKSPALFAALTELAQLGALRLHRPSQDKAITLEKVKEYDPGNLSDDQRFLLEALPFPPETNILELREGLQLQNKKLSERLRALVEKILIDKGIFREAPATIRQKFWRRNLLIVLPVVGGLLYEGYRRYGIEGILPATLLLLFALIGIRLFLDSLQKKARIGMLFGLLWLGMSGWVLMRLPYFASYEELLYSPFPWIAILLGWLLYRAGRLSPLSKQGEELYADLLGYREFMSRVESDRLRRTLRETPELLSLGIPYAILFGLLSPWLHTYRELNTEPPIWYDGPWEEFEPTLQDAMDQLETKTATDHSNYSGGGGFSGGGGGGGGGGSW